MRSQWKMVSSISVLLGMVMLYQNCSTHQAPKAVNLTFLSSACKGPAQAVFRDYYYTKFLTTADTTHNCLPCHGDGGEAGKSRAFASSNIETAYDVFASVTRDKVEANAINPAHKPPHTGDQNVAFIEAAAPAWAAAEEEMAACQQSTEIVTTAKTLPAAVYSCVPNANTSLCPGDGANWAKVSWDLDTEIRNTALVNKIHMTIALDVRRFAASGGTAAQAIGYQFRNPTVTLKAVNGVVPSYHIEGISMKLNGSNWGSLTGYELLTATVGSTAAATNIAPGMAYALGITRTKRVASSDTFALRFAAIADGTGQVINVPGGGGTITPDPLPTRVSFADLQSADAITGVFRRSCNSCHSSANRAGGLDITNYAAASALATTIRARMNNNANPMPPSGLPSSQDRQVVDIWLSSGTPQN